MAGASEEECIRLEPPLDKYYIDSRRSSFDIDAAWKYLSTEAFWGRYRTREIFDLQVSKAYMIFGLFLHQPGSKDSRMIGMARVVGDGDTNYLQDVYVEKEHAGGGLGGKFLDVVFDGNGRLDWRWIGHAGTNRARDWYVNRFGFKAIGHAGREKMLGIPLYLLERDGVAIKYEREKQKKVDAAKL